jgi:RimJ/RimL family protein N-acetyltransferase
MVIHADLMDAEPEGARHVRLRPIEPSDMPWLYRLATEGETAERWRYRGATPDRQTFANQLWDNVLTQSVVERVADHRLVGLVCAYNANLRDGFVYLAAVCDVPFSRTGLCAESLLLLAERVFRNWNFRKIYFEAPAFNYEQFASGANGYFCEEARLQDHTFYAGRYWDLVVGSMTRDGFNAVAELRKRRREPIGDSNALMGLDQFCAEVADLLDVAPGRVRPEARLIEDLGMDSLGALALQDLIERDGGVAELDLSDGLGTVREAYNLYLTAASVPLLTPSRQLR